MQEDNVRESEQVRKEYYYTLNNEVELDPEIAADLAMYANGSLASWSMFIELFANKVLYQMTSLAMRLD